MTATEMTDAPAVVEEPPSEQYTIPTSWEFLEPPTTEEVILKLKTLPPVWGIDMADFVEFVQPLSQSKNMSLQKGVKDYRDVWTLYFTVAGRIAMVNAAAQLHQWTVNFVPEPTTPTGIPGYLEAGDRYVYREYVEISQVVPVGEAGPGGGRDWVDRSLGRRPGTAWVPGSGGAGAVSSNRFEKVETSARGRAIAAWGFGVLPGSGVASLDEMQGMPDLRAAETGQKRAPRSPVQPTKADLDTALLVALEEYQQLAGVSDEAMDEKVQKFVYKTFGKEKVERLGGPDGPYDLWPLKGGEVSLFTNRMRAEIDKIKMESAEL